MNEKFLIKEIEALAQLDYPKIIRLITYFSLSSREIGLVLEYAAGGTLKKYLAEKGTIDEDEAKGIISSILEALHYCHLKGIVHRDLKLDNVVFGDCSRSTIKLIDFGISGVKKESINVGTLKYLPPEVVNGIDMDSKPSIDTWAIGCITYELLFGSQLFAGQDTNEIKLKVNTQQTIRSSKVSREACNFINNLLKININDRMTISQSLEHPWITNNKLESTDEDEEGELLYNKGITLSPVKIPKRLKAPLSIIKENKPPVCSFEDFLRKSIKDTSSSVLLKHSKKGLPTKVTQERNSYKMLDMNFQLLKEYGKIPTYLQPIGHSKDQKLKYLKLKENLIISENELNKRLSTICKQNEDHLDQAIPPKGEKRYKLSLSNKCFEAGENFRSGRCNKASVDLTKLKEEARSYSSLSPDKNSKQKKLIETKSSKFKGNKPVSSCIELVLSTNSHL